MRLITKHKVPTAALAIGLAAVLLAACGGGDNGDGGNATAAEPGGGVVSVQSVDGTKVLVDSQGRSLYTADVEQNGQIHCTGACTSIWMPVAASAGEAKSASSDLDLDLGVVGRPDGGKQLTFKGRPLYSFTEENSGQLNGDGVMDNFDGTQFKWTAATTGSGSGSASMGSGGSGYSSAY
jgi:predicted lipoprotein with Yx(FWY)xxD motif